MRAVLRTQVGGALRRPSRLLISGLAVLVVSFVVYATVLAHIITERSLINSLSDTSTAVDLVVHEGAPTTTMLDAIREIPGVAEAAGRADAGAGVSNQYLQIASDPGSGPLSQVQVASGRFPSGPGEIAVTPRTAERFGLPVGSTVKAEKQQLTVVGTVSVKDDYGFLAYASETTVEKLNGNDLLQQIDVRLKPGADRSAVGARIEPLLASVQGDDRPSLIDGDELRHQEATAKASELDTLFAVVGMFVAIAVVAAGLVAASTFRIVFAQRMRQLALMRAVGAGRASLAWSLAVEGALTGLITGVTGVLAALGVGTLVPAVLRATGRHVASPGFPVLEAAGTVLLAILITVLAVVAPAFSAARVSPLEALRGSATTGSKPGVGVARWILGLLMVAGAGALAAYVVTHLPHRNQENYDVQPMLLAIVGSGALAYFALIALGPALVRPVLAVAGWPIRRFGPVGRLAAGGVGAAPRRAAAVSVVVALGVTLTAGVLVGGASIRVLSDREAALSAPADYELTASEGGPAITPGILRKAEGSADLAHVTPYRRLPIVLPSGSGDQESDANDLTISALPHLGALDVASGSLRDLGPGTAVIAGVFADVLHARTGDTITVEHEKTTLRVRVAAVLADSAPLHSALVLDPSDLTKLGAPARQYSGLLADAAHDGEDGRNRGGTALRQAAGADGFGLDVLADQRDQIDSNLTIVLVIALGLIGLTVLIAVVGVGTTVALSVVERVREAGLLRAVGLARSGLRVMLTAEAAMYGVIGAVLGLLLGVPYAWLAVGALGVQAPLTLPVGQLAAVFAALVLLTALAGVLPARRAARVSPVAALGTD